MLGFCALGTDYGAQVGDANQLQRTCDAAVLAAAAELKMTGDDSADTARARQVAVNVAAENGVTVDPNAITFLNNNTAMRVPATRTRTFLFARVLGISTGTVTRAATAIVQAGRDLSTGGDPRVVPIGISWETYNAYRNDTSVHVINLVRQNKKTFGLDDFVTFDLRDDSSKSAEYMQRQLTGDDPETTHIGDVETTVDSDLPSQRIFFNNGMKELFQRSTQAPWYDAGDVGIRYNEILTGASPRDNPRVMHIIITPSTTIPNVGTFDAPVQGFAPIYVESLNTLKSPQTRIVQMTIRFLPPTNASDGQVEIDPNASLSGIRAISLVN